MEISDRPHRTNSSNNSGSSSTGELFICFTSRLSSSSMKLSSKSILSPGRAREPSNISLSNSLSRRLRSNGSMKGGQASPMFPTTGKKRDCAFENPEPSSPKVTCIGQVRVKTKKQSKKLRTRSKRRGEISFRRVEQNSNSNGSNNVDPGSSIQDYSLANHHTLQQQQREDLPHRHQRWVHLSLTICEALRTFGAEFNCFLPCRSSCLANDREKEEKTAGSGHGSSCGAVFARWLVTMQEGEGKGKEIELVVGEERKNESSDDERRGSCRRHVFEGIEFIDEKFGAGNEGREQEDEARVSICIPPKNALLLMKCRSDPVKIAALANKLWEAPIPQVEDEEEKIQVENSSPKFGEPAVAEYGDDRDETGNEESEKDMECNEENLMEEKSVALQAVEEQQIEDSEASAVHSEAKEDGGDTDTGYMQEDTSTTMGKQENEMGIEVMNQAEATQAPTVVYGSSHEEMIEARKSSASHHENEVVKEPLQENEDGLEEEEEVGEGEEKEEERETRDFGGDGIDDTTGSLIIANGREEGGGGAGPRLEPDLDQDQEPEAEGAGPRLEPDLDQDQEPEAEGAGPPTEVELLAIKEESEEEKETAEETSLVLRVGEEEEAAEKVTHQGSESEDPQIQACPAVSGPKSNRKGSQTLLPDCLLLMMCEPKLSMEVSKETWVCGTDFIRWLPDHSRPPVNKKNGQDETKQRRSIDLKAAAAANLQQPPRSSCSYPAKPPARRTGTESMSNMTEQKLSGTKTKGCEPLVLTRCKSEPMRSAAKLAPENCFWKNRKLEPHSSATLGVGAAGVGF